MSQKNAQELQQMIERLTERVSALEENLNSIWRQLNAGGIAIKLPRKPGSDE